MTDKIKLIAWLPNPSSLPAYLAAGTDEGRYSYLTMCKESLDMAEYNWLKVGFGEIECHLNTDTAEIKVMALAEVEKAITKTEVEFAEKLNALKALRSTILCLEAPK